MAHNRNQKKTLWFPFSAGVYRIVARIPRGRTLTYREVARRAGNPQAYRAVGNILNRNPDPKRVPCHRVICSDGRLGGYAWGTRRKAELLKKEGVLRPIPVSDRAHSR